jgi:hypothetical protein
VCLLRWGLQHKHYRDQTGYRKKRCKTSSKDQAVLLGLFVDLKA